MNLITRSFRLRVALLSAFGTSVIVMIVGVLLHEWLRRDALRRIDVIMESHARIIVSQPMRPIIWHEVERRLQLDDEETLLFVWLERHQAFYISNAWPPGVSPTEILPSLKLPANWKDLQIEQGSSEDEDVLGESGDILDFAPPRRRPPPPLGAREAVGDARILPAKAQVPADRDHRYAAFTDGEATLILGAPLAPVARELARFRGALMVAIPAATILSFLLGLFIATRSLLSIRRLVNVVEEITVAGLDKRLDARDAETEFARLIAVFNEMLHRLERSFLEARRFSDSAAHELRTPLTILIGKLDVAIHEESPGSERQQFLTELLEEVARLKGIADRLLLLARSDAGRLDLYPEDVDLSTLVDGLVEDARIIAPTIAFSADIPNGIHCTCDRSLVTQIVHNLLSNAMKYNVRENGRIRVELKQDSAAVSLAISNTGRAIPAELASRIFERFYRGDKSHSRRIEGTGLGLALAREIATAHGGSLRLQESGASGNTFVLKLPKDATKTPGTGLFAVTRSQG